MENILFLSCCSPAFTKKIFYNTTTQLVYEYWLEMNNKKNRIAVEILRSVFIRFKHKYMRNENDRLFFFI